METYYITGAQLGCLKALSSSEIDDNSEAIIEMIDEIIETQQVSDDARKLKLLTGKS